MLNIVVFLLRIFLRMRYRVTIKGLDRLKSADPRRGILFLPNHPALIDPLLLYVNLHARFRPRPLADEDQVDIPVVRSVMKMVRCVTIPDVISKGRYGRDEVLAAMAEITRSLKRGDNVLLYPAGRMYRSRREAVRGNGGVAAILKQTNNDIRVVLVRTTGLWGSSFSRASGRAPKFVRGMMKHGFYFLVNGLFLMPKRQVLIEFVEPVDLPHSGERLVVNRYLEEFYNKETPGSFTVPYFWWQGRAPHPRPEPREKKNVVGSAPVGKEVRQQVFAKIQEVCGAENINEGDNLASELGIDSLGIVELTTWIEQEYGFSVDDLEYLNTVNDILLAATGQISSSETK